MTAKNGVPPKGSSYRRTPNNTPKSKSKGCAILAIAGLGGVVLSIVAGLVELYAAL